MNYFTLLIQVPTVLVSMLLVIPNVNGQLKKLDLDGFEITYRESGQGETIVFIHGGQEDFRNFRNAADILDNNFRTIAYSRKYNYPNHNPYTKDTEFSAYTESQMLADLIGKISSGPVNVVGHSFGGLIAMHLAVNRPDLVKSLTVSEPALISWLPGIRGCSNWYDSVQTHLIDDTRIAFARRDTTLIMKELFEFFIGADIQNELPPSIIQPLLDNLDEMRAIVFADDAFADIPRQKLREVNMPVLIITTSGSRPLLQCINEALVETLPEARHVHFTNMGHELWSTNAEEVATAVSAFIQDN